MKTLYIIGNGFDLHHDINSSYKNFYQWMQNKGQWDVISQLEDIYGGGQEWWNDLEHSLGEVDMGEYATNQANEHYPNFASDAFRDADWYEAEIAIEQDFREAISLFKSSFVEWVEDLNQPNVLKKIPLNKENAFFINFNYTRTLEETYCIPNSLVWHPHGYIGESNSEYILGHGKSYLNLKEELKKQIPQPPQGLSAEELHDFYAENSDYIIERAQEATLSAVAGLQKPVSEIIDTKQDLWKQLKHVRNIYILGFSFSDIDEPYLEIILNNSQKFLIHWTITIHKDVDLERVHKFIKKFHLCPRRVRICTLKEMQDEG
ncbi:MAG: bacteriophage abortive infection AbiH family protein [Prevotellaceae bacterium]|nr:bacteriophage abortive infection AbiH family protein [Candidatus Faecinaster equi]